MIKLIFTITLLVLAGAAGDAYARQCTTTCSTVGGYTTCNTSCW